MSTDILLRFHHHHALLTESKRTRLPTTMQHKRFTGKSRLKNSWKREATS